jgi:hypothetical protein
MGILHSCKLGSVQFIPANGNNCAGYQLSLREVEGVAVTLPSRYRPDHIAGKKVDSIAFYFLKTSVISCV